MKYAIRQQRFRWLGPPRARWSVVALGCLLAGFLLGGAPNVYGQATINATLNGTVTDSSGAAVPGAIVTLTDPAKGFTRTQTTQTDGVYSFTLIPASTYNLRIEKAGFNIYLQSGILLTVGQAATQDVVLEVGAVTAEVKVTAAAPMVNTTNATVGSEVGTRETLELPLNWRNVFGLVALDSSVNPFPNVQTGPDITDQGITYSIMFGGGRARSTSYLLDGHWNNAGDWGGLVYAPGVDETQEFKVVTYAFTAQYGWTMGNVLNAITKSGTSKFHGGVFEFLRNSALDANNFFANSAGLEKPTFRRNNFGASAGGPLYIPGLYEQTNKTFIFGYYEGLRQSGPFTSRVTLPTAAMKNGDFSQLLGNELTQLNNCGEGGNQPCFDVLGRPVYDGAIYDPYSSREVTGGQTDSVTGLPVTGLASGEVGFVRDPFGASAANGWATPTNIIPPNRFDPVAANFLQYWPAPNAPGLTNNYLNNGSLPGWVDKYSVRVDHNISDKSRFFARWSRSRIYQQTGADIFGLDNPGGPGRANPNPRWDVGLAYTRTFSPTTVLSVTGGWNRWDERANPTTGRGFLASTTGLPAFLDLVPVFPYINVADILGLGGGDDGHAAREPRSLLVDVTKIHGSHTFTTGFQSIWTQLYEIIYDPAGFSFDRGMTNGPDPKGANSNTGYGFASFLLGTGTGSGVQGHFTSADAAGQFPFPAQTAFMKNYMGFYFQDDWKVNRKLTVNLGIRWDMQTAPTERFDRIWYFNFTDPGPLAGVAPSSFVGPDGHGGTTTYPLNLNGSMNPVGGSSPLGRSIYKAPLNNWAPRIGLAYRLTDKLVARAGFGIFFNETQEVSSYEGLDLYGYSSLTPWVATLDGMTPSNLLSDPFPDGYLQPVGKANGTSTQLGYSINTFPPNPRRPTPYVNQWMADIQYQIAPNDTITVGYVGNHGTKMPFGGITGNQLTPDKLVLGALLDQQVANPFFNEETQTSLISSNACSLNMPTVPLRQLLKPYPQYCAVQWRYPVGATTNYHSLGIKYNHRFSQGLHLLASYTWSNYKDNFSGPGFGYSASRDHIGLDYSLNFNDIPNSLVISYIYELPVGRGKRWGGNLGGVANAVLGGWQVAGITTFKSGFPLGIASGGTLNAGEASGRPNLIGDPTIASPYNLENGNIQWFNPDAFTRADPYTFGNTPRLMGNIRAAGRNNWDINVSKEWRWQEKLRVQFRGEFFNAFNTTYLLAPDTWYGSSTFGQVGGAGLPRDVQFGLKIYW